VFGIVSVHNIPIYDSILRRRRVPLPTARSCSAFRLALAP